MQRARNVTNSNKYEEVVNKFTIIENNVSTLQSYTVSNGTNFGIGPSVFNNLTTGTQNTAIGNSAAGGPHKLTTVNNNFLGTNTQLYPGEQSLWFHCIGIRGGN
jgi:hypothetical protein